MQLRAIVIAVHTKNTYPLLPGGGLPAVVLLLCRLQLCEQDVVNWLGLLPTCALQPINCERAQAVVVERHAQLLLLALRCCLEPHPPDCVDGYHNHVASKNPQHNLVKGVAAACCSTSWDHSVGWKETRASAVVVVFGVCGGREAVGVTGGDMDRRDSKSKAIEPVAGSYGRGGL